MVQQSMPTQYIWILGLAIFVTWLVECVDTLAVVNGLLMLKTAEENEIYDYTAGPDKHTAIIHE